MSSIWAGLLINLLLFVALLLIVMFVLHATIRAAVRNALRDHDTYREEQSQAADRIRSRSET
ncbi:hypothetical protein I2485_04880 [Nesterenkonia sp. E16_7]|uniref:hypothetical protein n=1 Tax=unclassified Nesterenkonia TaxID=2629769 RepID=UPI001A92AA4A|nr:MULTISPECIES: hypothetical protein [unclassified Nesterenkonia]MBO0596626.1 hypothetical protein [Nesterenkonia sp. E16_10]MBO0597981.1 hypothetical protein [Nesterenkonia sp. E16_7]